MTSEYLAKHLAKYLSHMLQHTTPQQAPAIREDVVNGLEGGAAVA